MKRRWTRGPLNECIEVSPVYFFGSSISSSEVVGSIDDNDNDDDKHSSPIAVMAVHFWSCDDRYGSPRVGDLQSKSVQSTTPSKVATRRDGQRHKALPYGCRTGRILNLPYATINGVVDT